MPMGKCLKIPYNTHVYMDKASDKTYSSHILEAIIEIQSFIQGMTFEQFETDIKTQRAVTKKS